jgi:hypothetical protein
MTTQHRDTIDPSVTAWASFSSHGPKHELEAPPQEVDATWRWGWNWFIGIHYGPIPVGMIIGLPILIALRM